jgi:hypothetical protein
MLLSENKSLYDHADEVVDVVVVTLISSIEPPWRK